MAAGHGKSELCKILVFFYLSSIFFAYTFNTKLLNVAPSFLVASDGDKISYPGRNDGLTRKYISGQRVLPCVKIAKALLLVKLSLSASYIVLLSGDVSRNPGPTKFSTTEVCAVCLKEITKKQPWLDCISCKQDIHLKCLGDDFETSGLCRLCCAPDASVND